MEKRIRHSTHFIYGKYGLRHMVNDHSDSKGGNPLRPLHGLLFLISSKGSFFYIHYPIDRRAHTMAICYTNRGAVAGMRLLKSTYPLASDCQYGQNSPVKAGTK